MYETNQLKWPVKSYNKGVDNHGSQSSETTKSSPCSRKPQSLNQSRNREKKQLEDKYRPNADKIGCPDWLDAEAKKHWDTLSSELQELDLLTNVDVGALAICCNAFSKYIKANLEIEKHGMLVTYTNKGGNKNIVPNPYVAMSNKYSDVYKRYCTEFGLTPAARIRLATPKEEPKPLTEFERKFGEL